MLNRDLIQNIDQYETPFYFYDLNLLSKTLKILRTEADRLGYHLHYALKANYNDKILSEIFDNGLGADCVSGNEIRKALEIGFKPKDIVFAGVGKTDKEIRIALENSIFSLNCESFAELEVINEIAFEMDVIAPVSLRLNPEINANSHPFISTGLKENKFGIHLHDLDMVIDSLKFMKNVELIGLHFHIGSQITDYSAFQNLCYKINQIQEHLATKNILVPHINVGGGVGINYNNPVSEPIVDFQGYFQVFKDHLELVPNQKLHFELGRSVVGQCGTLISKVSYVKNGIDKSFVILDAGMNDLIRPALYEANHLIENISSQSSWINTYDVVGPVCESSDCFGKDIAMNQTKRGDIIAIYSTGAYGQTMGSNYNLRDNTNVVYSDEILADQKIKAVFSNVDA